MTEPLAQVEVEPRDDAVHVTIGGEIDLSNADEVEQEIRTATAAAASVVIDLRPVDYLDSRGVRLLHHLSRGYAEAGVALTVVAPKDTIAGSVLRLTQLPDLALDD